MNGYPSIVPLVGNVLMLLCFLSCGNSKGKFDGMLRDSLIVVNRQAPMLTINSAPMDTTVGMSDVEERQCHTSACDGVGVGTARVNPYYDAGYEAGYEAGYDDGVDNWRHESYDDGCRYRKWKRKEYQLGYEEGYETGFDDGYADSGGDPDMEE